MSPSSSSKASSPSSSSAISSTSTPMPTPSTLISKAPPTTSSTTAPDTEELAQFRQRWKQEVRDQDRGREKLRGTARGAGNVNSTPAKAGADVGHGQRSVGRGRAPVGLRASMSLSPDRQTDSSHDVQASAEIGLSSVGQVSAYTSTTTAPNRAPAPSIPTSSARPLASLQVSPRLKSALALYSNAILEEQKGNHTEATRLYRRAFWLDSDVDKVHHREEMAKEKTRLSRLGNGPGSFSTVSTEGTSSPLAAVTLQVQLGHLKLDSLEPSESRLPQSSKPSDASREYQSHPSNILSLVSSWTDPIPEFLPSDERLTVPLIKIPNELIIHILVMFVWSGDAASIEQFALACKKMRILTLDGSIWRKFLEINLVPYQLSEPGLSIDDLCFRLYRSDYRRMFIEHPRIRFDGVYIAICHYIRNGVSENPWFSMPIPHLITYRRFLRFFPNGKVFSYQANEDQEISEVVHSLQPSIVKKDLRIGDWQLLGTWMYITNLADVVPSRFRGIDRFNFQMKLSLKSRPCLGRWNKLDILDYESVDVETGDVSPFALRHERPYWFSKVRSYTF